MLASLGLGIALAAAASSPPTPQPAAPGGTPPPLRKGSFTLTEADRAYWAFQPVAKPPLPVPPRGPAPRNAVDAFILGRLAGRGLAMNPPATRRELIRRASFDLTGLPPTPEEVAAFEADTSTGAWERLVDRLLGSPHYGERWARHWLDLVRFAESNGYERDGEKPNAWRYRDYVISSFNADKPYDRFIREQIAGDEIAAELQRADKAGTPEWRQAIIATGFYRLHVWDDEPDSTLAAEFDDLDDILSTTGTAFLGITLGCARCHDHKFDPLSQADYYSMLSFLRNIDPYGQHHTGGGGRGTGKITRPLGSPAEVARWEAEGRELLKGAEARLAAATDPAARKPIEEEIARIKGRTPPYGAALAVAEVGGAPKPTHLLIRGRVESPGTEVSPAFPAIFGVAPPAIPPPGPEAVTTGRRRALADWVASPRNPLTARVWVNRVWQHLFGAGLVRTPDDFGRTGTGPTHPELLDWLAAEFVEGGWSIKRLQKRILLSDAYRMSSRAANKQALAIDEGNELWWRQNLRRVESEVLRDTLLEVSGDLNRKMGGPSVYPSLPHEVHITQDSAGKGWGESPPEEQARRSVYVFVKRALKLPILETFDFANCTSAMGQRPVTTIAPQALMGLNDAFLHARAEGLARRVAREAGLKPEARLDRAFQLVLQRAPAPGERRSALRLLQEEGNGDAAWKSLCLALLNLNEMVYVD